MTDNSEKISWRLYEGERFGFSVIKRGYISEHDIKSETGIRRRATLVSKKIDKPVVVTKKIKYGKEECYRIFFPEGGHIGCEALIKKKDINIKLLS